MFDQRQVDVYVAELAGGVVSPPFYAAYRRYAEQNADEAGDIVAGLLGPAGSRLAARTRRAVAVQSEAALARTAKRMTPTEREAFVRRVGAAG